jgi:hypothetical protein
MAVQLEQRGRSTQLFEQALHDHNGNLPDSNPSGLSKDQPQDLWRTDGNHQAESGSISKHHPVLSQFEAVGSSCWKSGFVPTLNSNLPEHGFLEQPIQVSVRDCPRNRGDEIFHNQRQEGIPAGKKYVDISVHYIRDPKYLKLVLFIRL